MLSLAAGCLYIPKGLLVQSDFVIVAEPAQLLNFVRVIAST